MADNRLEPLVLTGDERRTLESWVRRRSTAQGLALRARIVLACAQGGSNTAVAARLGVSRTTVRKWRTRFLRARLDGLPDEPRPGVPRTITDAQVEEVVVRTLEEVPEGSTHWSKRELAARVGISPTSVHRIWRAFGLQPWRTETFKISPDPLLIGKIRDVVGLYLAPPANAVVFSVDEKPQIQAYPGDDPGVCYGGQEPDMTDSRSLTDRISGVSPEQSQRPRTVARRRSVHPGLAAPPVAEPSPHPGLVVAASLADAPATVLTAETCPSSHRTPDNQALERTRPILPTTTQRASTPTSGPG